MNKNLKTQQEGWRIADFFSHHPESMHMFTFLLDDVGIPLNYRHMEGFGVHTYTLMTRDGKVSFFFFRRFFVVVVLLFLSLLNSLSPSSLSPPS